MKNVPSQSGAQPAASSQVCRTCRQGQPTAAFYDGCSECKTCKRARSKQNRALQARKIAAFERFVDALFLMAERHGDSADSREVA